MNKKLYHIITIGCQMNKADSERVTAVLENQGFKPTENRYRADLVIINTCGVRQSAENRVYGLIPQIKKENPKVKIVLTGCLVNREDVRRRLEEYVDQWLPISKITNYKLQTTNKFQIPKSKYQNNYLSIKPKYQSKISAFVPIGNGCNNYCSYCVVPYARGREVWRPASEIINEVKELVKNGYKEIILIAQNVNSYNSQIKHKLKTNYHKSNINFASLLQLINDISGDFWIRFATSHPKDMSDKLIQIMAKCQKVFPSIHLPVQSGDNEILRKMNRNYTIGHYKKLIKKIRAAFKKYHPGIKVEISTDIIVGFPGETKKQFQNTVKLGKEIKFDKAYVARYSPRPGTAAAKLKDDVSAQEKKCRWLVLENFINK